MAPVQQFLMSYRSHQELRRTGESGGEVPAPRPESVALGSARKPGLLQEAFPASGQAEIPDLGSYEGKEMRPQHSSGKRAPSLPCDRARAESGPSLTPEPGCGSRVGTDDDKSTWQRLGNWHGH